MKTPCFFVVATTLFYAKRPFGGPCQVLKYLARYSHRVAISSRRLVQLSDDRVSFRYKDYADGSSIKSMKLDLHVQSLMVPDPDRHATGSDGDRYSQKARFPRLKLQRLGFGVDSIKPGGFCIAAERR